MKLPRVLVSAVLWGCSGQPMTGDGGTPDGGNTDAGQTDGGGEGPCTLNMPCDAGAGLDFGYCAAITGDDGGIYPYCEMAV